MPIPQEIQFILILCGTGIVEQASWNRHRGTGIVEQASCLFLTMVHLQSETQAGCCGVNTVPDRINQFPMTSKRNLKSIAPAIPMQTAIALTFSASLALAAIAPILPLQPVWAAPAQESDRAVWLELTRQLLLYNVELTSQQEERLQPIFQQAHAQMQHLLSPAQMTQFQSSLREGSGLRSAIAQMQLSPVQEIQAQNILQATGLKAAPILTPEQRSQIEANLQTQLEDS